MSITEFIGHPITEAGSSAATSETLGLAFPILIADGSGETACVLSWARGLTNRMGFEFVYVFKGTHNGVERFKIGKARSIKDRRSIFAVKLPFDIELVAAFRVANARAAEARIHKMFSQFRVGGEWFDLGGVAFDAVCRIGMSIELHDLANAIQANACQSEEPLLMSDSEYIAHLEGLLALQGVTFSRTKEG